jgi:hypothetical protein
VLTEQFDTPSLELPRIDRTLVDTTIAIDLLDDPNPHSLMIEEGLNTLQNRSILDSPLNKPK